VLHAIRSRYAQHEIYTYSGIVLIAVNPFQRVALYGPEAIQSYTTKSKTELDPHLFAIAQEAHVRMRKDNMGQTIIVSGESAPGKRSLRSSLCGFSHPSLVPKAMAHGRSH
jgi:myosin-5